MNFDKYSVNNITLFLFLPPGKPGFIKGDTLLVKTSGGFPSDTSNQKPIPVPHQRKKDYSVFSAIAFTH
ncbi:hypothetical protein [Nostoc sp.]